MSLKQLFISYARKDQAIVQKWHDRLEELGLEVWWDPEEQLGGNWLDQIATWIYKADAILVVVSNASIHSPWVCNEIRSAHRIGRLVIPIVLDEPTTGGLWLLIDHLQWVDARVHHDPAAAIAQFLQQGLNQAQTDIPPLSKLLPPRRKSSATTRLTLTIVADPEEVGLPQRQQLQQLFCDVMNVEAQELQIVHLVPEGDHVLVTLDLPETTAEWLSACQRQNDRLTQMLGVTKIVVATLPRLLNNRYEIIDERLGEESGAGQVSKAIDTRLNIPVALKQALKGNPQFIEALRNELLLARPELSHSSLPGVTDQFVEHDVLYIVMNYIDGDDLQQMMKKQLNGRFSIAEVLPWAKELLEVLDFLHSQKTPIIHRDVKPANIKLRPDGRIVLIDFGLAKSEKTNLRGYTGRYAPPEQLHGKSTDQRGDLFSLAATLHHLLTGHWPDDEVRRGAKTTHALNAEVPAQLSDLLMRAMAAEPSARPASARSMLRELNRIIASVFPPAETLYQKAVEQQFQNNLADAEELLRQALTTDAKHWPARHRLGELLVQQQRFAEALPELETIYRVRPDEGRDALLAALRRNAELLRQQGDNGAALRHCEQIRSIAPDDEFARQCVNAVWLERGDKARTAGDLDSATTAYEVVGASEQVAAIATLRQEMELAFLTAAAQEYEEEQSWGQAKRLYERLARLDPGDPRWSAASERINASLRLQQDYEQGRRAFDAGDWTRAIAALRSVLMAQPTYEDASELFAEAVRRSKRV